MRDPRWGVPTTGGPDANRGDQLKGGSPNCRRPKATERPTNEENLKDEQPGVCFCVFSPA